MFFFCLLTDTFDKYHMNISGRQNDATDNLQEERMYKGPLGGSVLCTVCILFKCCKCFSGETALRVQHFAQGDFQLLTGFLSSKR